MAKLDWNITERLTRGLDFAVVFDGWLYEWFNAYRVVAILPGNDCRMIPDDLRGKNYGLMVRPIGIVVYDDYSQIGNSSKGGAL